MNKKISITIAVTIGLLNLVLASYYLGSGRVSYIGQALCRDFTGVSGQYDFLIKIHFYLVASSVIFVIFKVIEKSITTQLTCFFMLLVALGLYLRVTALLIANSEFSFTENLSNTTSALDFISLSLLAVLLIGQSRLVVMTIRRPRDIR